ncbi:histone deacetylase family protein [Govanella unica]|uniref:Histone deacetylase family protein n=1 Tax=Govanella unica TaxID=2975056 RepID=A0A9X3TY06_9PROT|nr:histone deacetylase family protein [Govania unica]MDA5193828.1 histone deacetylase family protein [Govania unica]
MKTVYSDKHHLHHGQAELFAGKLVPCFEMPSRADMIFAEVKKRNLGEILVPQNFDRTRIERVHRPAYVDFLEQAWADWTAIGETTDILPICTPARDMRSDRIPQNIHGRVSYFSFDTTAPITSGTWTAAKTAADVALTAQNLITKGARSAFALCRPPGHHASSDYYGGYCFLNNAAIAAQGFRDAGAARVAILDVDYHHGNGTQSIFYDRSDVYFASVHGDPATSYPFFLGYGDETGRGPGEGCNANYPLAAGTSAETWFEALEIACAGVQRYQPDALVISLGVDTYEGDPISYFKLKSEDFLKMGDRLARLDLPTLFVMEGGYAVEDLGVNTVNVLEAFAHKNP